MWKIAGRMILLPGDLVDSGEDLLVRKVRLLARGPLGSRYRLAATNQNAAGRRRSR